MLAYYGSMISFITSGAPALAKAKALVVFQGTFAHTPCGTLVLPVSPRSTGVFDSVPYPLVLAWLPEVLHSKGSLVNFDISDILFLVVVLWIAIEILNNGDWGGGRRVRVDDRVVVPAG